MDNNIKHYGVPGMKWGHRMSRAVASPIGGAVIKTIAKSHQMVANRQRKAAGKIDKDYASINEQKKQMMGLTKNGKSLFSEKEINTMLSSLHDQSKKLNSKANNHEQFAKQLLSNIGQIKHRDIKK